ncbi:MAG TPA: hypothetical protein VFC19_04105 [Candidatus Limnocylindrales bacterium]|nr:hypothetical protein [Candidatus Limnocylindrales bacterium]
MKKILKNPFFLILLGTLAIYIAFQGTTDKVMCGEVEMKPTDSCGTLSYADKERGGTIFTYGMIGLGVALIAGSVMNIRKKRKK